MIHPAALSGMSQDKPAGGVAAPPSATPLYELLWVVCPVANP